MTGSLLVLAKDVAKLAVFTGQAPTRQNDVASNSSSVEMEKPCATRMKKRKSNRRNGKQERMKKGRR